MEMGPEGKTTFMSVFYVKVVSVLVLHSCDDYRRDRSSTVDLRVRVCCRWQ